MDIRTDALLAAIRDALAVPYPGTPEARPAYADLVRYRSAAVRDAAAYAAATDDLETALATIDRAVADMPVTYPVDPLWSPLGMTAAVTR